MLVRVLKKRIPCIGVKGDVRSVPDRAARVLLTLGYVERVMEPEEPKKPEKPKREYRRRDMQAERQAEEGTSPRKRRSL
jgi:hypothetical protein